MSRKSAHDLPPLSSWQPRLVRLTAFPSPAAQIYGEEWWTSVIGEAPEMIKSLPQKNERHVEGQWGNGKLELSSQPIRVDWRYSIVEEEPSVDEFQTLGPIAEALDAFRHLMSRWLKSDTAPPLIRLAFGAVLIQPVDSHVAGYKLLSRYLPFDLDGESSSDFFYQINRGRASTVSDVAINRLSKWAVAYLKQATISPGSPLIYEFPDLFAAQLEVDINTAPEHDKELPRAQLAELFDELVDLAIEIAQKGDVP